jgi:hypothetical protein
MPDTKIPYVTIGLTDNRPIKVYDVANQQLIYTFPPIKAAAIFLQISESTITSCLRNKSRIKATTNKLKIVLALR